jgi:hypothetical protein
LFKAFEDWALHIGARRLSVGHLARLMPDKFRKFFLSRGFEMNEVNYTKNIP